jgi:hypothetical protein
MLKPARLNSQIGEFFLEPARVILKLKAQHLLLSIHCITHFRFGDDISIHYSSDAVAGRLGDCASRQTQECSESEQ